MGLSGKGERGSPRGLRASPLPLVLLGLGEGAGHPPPSFPLGNPSWNRIREVGKEGERRRGAPPPSLLVLFGLGGGERGPVLATSPLFH